MDFEKLNVAKKNEPYPLPFIEEVLDMVLSMKSTHFWMAFQVIIR
jgi:hypothetical protein